MRDEGHDIQEHRMVSLPPGVEEMTLLAGHLRVKAAPEPRGAQLSLIANGQAHTLQPVTDDSTQASPFIASIPLNDPPLQAEALDLATDTLCPAQNLCEAQINALPDWMLANGETLHLRFFDRSRPVLVTLAQGLTLPPHRQPLMFRAAIAAHRARAELRIEIAPHDGGPVQTETLAFDTARTGGQFRSGYQDIAVPIPASAEPCQISLQIAYLGYMPSEEDNDPFLFLADPEVVPRHAAQPVLAPVRLRAAPVPEAQWFAADIPGPVLAGSGAVRLELGTESVSVFEPKQGRVTLLDHRGHGLSMQAVEAGRYSLFLDNTPVLAAHIGTAPTDIRLPAAQMTGGMRLLSVRDLSGTQVFLETYVLMPQALTPEDVLQRVSKPPYAGHLSNRAGHRYDALKAHLTDPGLAQDMAQTAYALGVLEGGHEAVTLTPLTFPTIESPAVSVIIPAHNKVGLTYYTLCALLVAKNKTTFEVIVVDDASSDETSYLETIVSGITVIHNSEPQRFIRACNAGVAAAKAPYVVLLNNDTEPTAGWLDALVDAFDRFPNVGLVGSKLLYPDGTLQDAGGLIWGSGNPWNYGNRQNPWDPRFCYARQADYLSGAALMTKRSIWDDVGGLSDYLEPMYFEDTDLAFKIREAGYSTWFVPSSVVYHFEGMTSGTDVSSGFKQYQEVNRPKFKRRWAQAFTAFGTEGQNPDLEKDRGIAGRVLFLDYTTPCPDRDAGSYAAIQEMKLVQSLGYKVTFVPQNLAHLGAYTHDLERDGIEVVAAPFCLSLDDFLDTRGQEFDAIYITRYYVGRAVIDKIRRAAPKAKVLFNTADLHFLRTLRTALVQQDPDGIDKARDIRGEELAMIARADVVLSYNDVETAVIQSHTDGVVPVVKCPWVVEMPGDVPGFETRSGLSFLGSFNHHPNREGLTWFARDVMPQLTEPPRVLSVYGANMDDSLRALASDVINPVGYIKTVDMAYNRHRIFVAPLLSGAGIKGKVIAALAHGVPCILSPVAAEGVGLRDGHDCLIAQSAAEWVSAIQRLYDDAALWQSLSQNARSYVEEDYSFATGQRLMRAAFETADLYSTLCEPVI